MLWTFKSLFTTELNLSNNQFTGDIESVINQISEMTNLTILNLSSNQLTGSIPPEIGNFTNLEDLYLHYNQLTGSIPSEIGNLTNLQELFLFDNQLNRSIPESICNLTLNFSSGGNFNISNNQLCPPYPSCVEDYVGTQDTSDCN